MYIVYVYVLCTIYYMYVLYNSRIYIDLYGVNICLYHILSLYGVIIWVHILIIRTYIDDQDVG